jgi:hypothetical protein
MCVSMAHPAGRMAVKKLTTRGVRLGLTQVASESAPEPSVLRTIGMGIEIVRVVFPRAADVHRHEDTEISFGVSRSARVIRRQQRQVDELISVQNLVRAKRVRSHDPRIRGSDGRYEEEIAKGALPLPLELRCVGARGRHMFKKPVDTLLPRLGLHKLPNPTTDIEPVIGISQVLVCECVQYLETVGKRRMCRCRRP